MGLKTMRFAGTTALVSLFLVLALFVAFLRSDGMTTLESSENTGPSLNSSNMCLGELRPCVRLLGQTAAVAVHQTINLIARLAFIEPAISLGFIDRGWGLMYVTKLEDPKAKRKALIYQEKINYQNIMALISRITFVILCLSPVLFFSMSTISGALPQSLFILVALSPLLGWSPEVVSGFYHLALVFVDWPISYYHFQRHLNPHDFFTISLLVIAIWLISTRKTDQRWIVIVAATVGQLTIEFLGFLFGVALFVAALIDTTEPNIKHRFKTGFSQLTLVGVVSLVSMGITTGVVYLQGDYSILNQAPESQELSNIQRAVRWSALQNTLLIYKHIIADFISLTAIPLIGGAIFGALASLPIFKNPDFDTKRAYRDTLAGIGLATGYVLSAIIGVLFIEYPAEMGRQFAPLGMLLAITAFRATQFGILGNRSQVT